MTYLHLSRPKKYKFEVPFCKCSTGLMLIELIIAIAVLGIVAVMIELGLSTAFKSNTIADRQAQAISLAEQQVEDLQSQPYITWDGTQHYKEITLPSSSYHILSMDGDGNLSRDIIWGVPWDTNTGQISRDTSSNIVDTGIQRFYLVVQFDNSNIYTLEAYKAKR